MTQNALLMLSLFFKSRCATLTHSHPTAFDVILCSDSHLHYIVLKRSESHLLPAFSWLCRREAFVILCCGRYLQVSICQSDPHCVHFTWILPLIYANLHLKWSLKTST